MAHTFQIDPETKRKWLPTSSSAVRVSYYHDPGRKTYRIIAIENTKVRKLLFAGWAGHQTRIAAGVRSITPLESKGGTGRKVAVTFSYQSVFVHLLWEVH